MKYRAKNLIKVSTDAKTTNYAVKVTFELPLVAQSENKMHFIWNFTEVLQSPIKIWVSERKRREQEIVWTNSSFKSELRHPWVRHKNCHFRFPAWCIKHTQELGLPHSFLPMALQESLEGSRAQSTLGRSVSPLSRVIPASFLPPARANRNVR